jgi:NADH-quinone oxidoreductase subunit A
MEYIPVLIMMAVGLLIGTVIVTLSQLLGPRIASRFKDAPFECGVPPLNDAKQRFSVRFYLVAILFLLFDVEAIFFFPFALIYREFLGFNHFILIEMGVFVFILLIGYFYVLRKGALDWE